MHFGYEVIKNTPGKEPVVIVWLMEHWEARRLCGTMNRLHGTMDLFEVRLKKLKKELLLD